MKTISSMNCSDSLVYTTKIKYQLVFTIFLLYAVLAISSLFLFNSAKNSQFIFALDIPFFESVDLTTTPVATIHEVIECYPNVTMSVSSIDNKDSILTITTSGTNNSDTEQHFDSSQFQLSKQDTALPYDQGLLTSTVSWDYTVKPHSDYSFTQYYRNSDTDSAFTLTMSNANNEIIEHFLFLSSDMS